jgi:hypothetical protein
MAKLSMLDSKNDHPLKKFLVKNNMGFLWQF